jgi:transcription-repair coupling factor (superfamily II helicase)
VVLVTDTPGEAESLFADLQTLGEARGIRYLPQRETLPYEETDPHVEISSRCAEAFASLLSGDARLLVTTSRGLIERSPVAVDGPFGLTLRVDDPIDRDGLAGRLEQMGFERATGVRELGEFVVRGGILDVFPFGTEEPLRIELWDERIASLRRFSTCSRSARPRGWMRSRSFRWSSPTR